MTRIVGLDFETEVVEPFDATRMRITEIGAVLFDTESKKPLKIMSEMVWSCDHTFHPLMQEITGITEAELKEFGKLPIVALPRLLSLLAEGEAIVAHNGNLFDKVVLKAECERYHLDFPATPWIDTTCDIVYPKKIETRKLEFLAPTHGFINPFAHRALFDVLTMMKVLSCYDFDAVLERSKEPNIVVRAMVAKPYGPTAIQGKKENVEAKARGFRFDDINKIWTKTIKEHEYAEVAAEAPWQVVILK